MRIHLVFATMAVVLFFFAISRSPRAEFTFSKVVAEARRLSEQPHRIVASPVPQFLREIGYDQYRDLRFSEPETLWRKLGRPFQVRFFHPGYLYNRIVEMYEVDDDKVQRVRYTPEMFYFEHSMAPTKEKVPPDLGFAGFRVHYPINRNDVLDEVISFLGESYFRAVAKDQAWGLSARGLAINPAASTKEEFPAFTKFWLRRPDSYTRALQFYALLESSSVTGAYEFRLEPGEDTRLRVKATLFPRRNIEQLACAPLTSMFWYGENTSNTFGDFRPEVHDSDGLLVLSRNNNWVWRPLSWAPRAQHNSFADARGFGLLQRDRDFSHYQDLEARYHQRPSVWVELSKDSPRGNVHLMQLPTKDEYADNVVAFWTPEGSTKAGQPIHLEYILHWFMDGPEWPPLGRCIGTRIDKQEAPFERQFHLDFRSDRLKGVKPEAGLKADVWTSDNAVAKEITIQKNDYDQSWRTSFSLTKKQTGKPVEIRCALKLGNQPVTETWTYTWLP